MENENREANEWIDRGIEKKNNFFYRAAIKCYDRAIELDPNNARIWFLKGEVLILISKHLEALACYDKIINLDPNSRWASKAQQNKDAILDKSNLEQINDGGKPVYVQSPDSLQVLSRTGIFLFIGALCFIGGTVYLIISVMSEDWLGCFNSVILIFLAIAWFEIARKFSFMKDYLKSRNQGKV